MAVDRGPIGIGLTRRCVESLPATVFLALLMTVAPVAAQGPFEKLARNVPSTANAIVLLNVDKALASPQGMQEGWKENLEKAHESGLTSVPPNAARMVSATQLDFNTMQPIWEMAVADLNVDPSMTEIARSQGGKLDTVNKLPAAVLPSNVYVVQLGPRTVGGMSPANRQNVARWVREAKSKSHANLSPYLTEAVGYLDKVGTPIILAIDLADVLPVEYVKQRIKTSELLPKLQGRHDIDVDQLARVLSTVRGMTLGIVIQTRTYGQLKIDFDTDASMLQGYAKLLLLEVLGNNGIMIDDFKQWEPKIEGNRISIKGYLSKTGLRQVLSVFEPPTVSAPEPPAAETTDPTDKVAYASQQYFRTVNRVLDDLRNKKNVKTIAQYGTWFNNYARKIDRLPMVDVDPDMLNYGGFVSEQLRGAAAAIKGIGMNSRVRQVNKGSSPVYGGYRSPTPTVGYGNYGGPVFSSWVPPRYESQRERSRIQTEEKVAGAQSTMEIMQDIENATASIRRAMTQKYKIEF